MNNSIKQIHPIPTLCVLNKSLTSFLEEIVSFSLFCRQAIGTFRSQVSCLLFKWTSTADDLMNDDPHAINVAFFTAREIWVT